MHGKSAILVRMNLMGMPNTVTTIMETVKYVTTSSGLKIRSRSPVLIESLTMVAS